MSDLWEPASPEAETAAAAGIHCIPVPTPFMVGPVNLYLIDDDPLTLVDTGPGSGIALEALAAGLKSLGHSVDSIERIVLTHQHMDHIGLAGVLARRTDAEVVALEGLRLALGSYEEWMATDDDFAGQVMKRHGIPNDVRLSLKAVTASFRAWGAPVEVDRTIREGDQLRFEGRSLEVFERPGHSPSDTIFLDRASGILLSGDHLLAGVSSNPLTARPLEWGLPGDPDAEALRRPHQLEIYLESLAKTEEMDGVELILGGHGPAFTDAAGLIATRRSMHERRAARIHSLLSEKPATAYELSEMMWGNIAVTQAYLTLSEVLGHIDLLAGAGEIRCGEQDGIVTWEAS